MSNTLFAAQSVNPASPDRTRSRAFAESLWPPLIYASVYVVLATLLIVLPARDPLGAPLSLSAAFGLSLLSAICFWIHAEIIRPDRAHKATRLCLLYTTVLLTLLVGLACESVVEFVWDDLGGDGYTPQVLQISLPLILPHILAPTMLTLLLGPAFGTIAGIGLSSLLTLQLLLLELVHPPQEKFLDVGLAAGCLLTGLVSAVIVPMAIKLRRVHTYRQLFRSTPVILSASATGLVAWAMVMGGSERDFGDMFQGWWQWLGVVLGMLVLAFSACLLQLLITVILHTYLERIFAVTSDISLQSFTDPTLPLQEKLQQEAPGTMDHSRQVSVIAAGAARAIGANDYLIRVAALYHDVGKLQNPGLFTENQRCHRGDSPHNTLSPQTSANHIIAHVQNGCDLAKRQKLPPAVLDLILQHHGTTLVAFFHDKAVKAADAAGSPRPDEATFRYPGPKPSTKEAGILMLADSIEAASRSLTETDEQSFRNLVSKILNGKLLDGQFDNCPLTMAEISVVCDSICNSLLSQYHVRIAYPEPTTSAPAPVSEPSPASVPAAPSDTPAPSATTGETAPVEAVEPVEAAAPEDTAPAAPATPAEPSAAPGPETEKPAEPTSPEAPAAEAST